MTSLLRQIVAGPRTKHSETGLDLCYVTSNIVATSGPSQTYPQLAYRNPLDRLVAFLDSKHGDRWAIWEFRAEGTGYPDEAVYHRIRHYPWPDHHPPPFRLVPMIVASMRQWLEGGEKGTKGTNSGDGEGIDSDRVVVVHCKAGKGRSGTMACSYLIAECGWTPQQALDRFTARRMRPKFGAGVTIPSQLRWIGYVERWARHGKPRYVDRAVEIVEVHVWGLRHGVKLSVEGYVDEGKKIRIFHTFKNAERLVVEGDAPGGGGLVDLVSDMAGNFSPTGQSKSSSKSSTPVSRSSTNLDTLQDGGSGGVARAKTDLIQMDNASVPVNVEQLQCKSESAPALSTAPTATKVSPATSASSSLVPKQTFSYASQDEPGGQAVIFKPQTPICLPNSDINIAIERRNKTPASIGLTMVTAVAHVWFNVFFEGDGPENGGKPTDSGVFAIEWDNLDGIKGSSQKGSRAADRIAVVWRAVGRETEEQKGTEEPGAKGEEDVPQMQPADWKGDNREDPDASKHLGLRREDPDSAGVSCASSLRSVPIGSPSVESSGGGDEGPLIGVKATGPDGEALCKSGGSGTTESNS